MAIWVNVNRAAKFPEVMKVYKRGGTGQGSVQVAGQSQTTGNPTSARRGFLETVRFAFTQAAGASLPTWMRRAPGVATSGIGNDWQAAQVDVTAIPGVRRLNTNGKWYRYDQF
jgi:hypothetical protein